MLKNWRIIINLFTLEDYSWYFNGSMAKYYKQLFSSLTLQKSLISRLSKFISVCWFSDGSNYNSSTPYHHRTTRKPFIQIRQSNINAKLMFTIKIYNRTVKSLFFQRCRLKLTKDVRLHLNYNHRHYLSVGIRSSSLLCGRWSSEFRLAAAPTDQRL